MKYIVFFVFSVTLFYPVWSKAQINQKINVSVDFSSAFHHYQDDDINNPYYVGANISYELDFSSYLGIQLGIRVGGFRQETGFDYDLFQRKQILYNGNYYTPYLAPIVYLPVWFNERYDQPSKFFLKFTPYYGKITLRTEGFGKKSSFNFDYDIQLGYQYPITKGWFIQAWVGYSSFDYGIVSSPSIDLNTSTPLVIGLGVCFDFKK